LNSKTPESPDHRAKAATEGDGPGSSPPATGSGAKKPKAPRYGGATRERERGDGTPLDLWFARAPVREGQPLLIFQHIRKTAGTSFRRVLEDNIRGGRHLFMSAPKEDDATADLGAWYEQYWKALRGREREALIGAASHSANFLIPLTDRPVRALTILRDPIDRVLSRYYFFNNQKDWTLNDYYSTDKATRNPEFFNGQARSLLAPHYDVTRLGFDVGPGPDADVWRARLFRVLSEYYTVGISERFDESVRLIGRQLGWRRLDIPEVRVNAERTRDEVLDDEAYTRVRDANWLDVEMYEHFAATLGDLFEVGDELEARALGYRAKLDGGSAEKLPTIVERLHGENLALRTRITALERRVARLEYDEPIPPL
jgi:hypothetical protein